MSDNHEMEFVAGVGWYEGEYKNGKFDGKGSFTFRTAESMKDNLKMVTNMAKEHSLFLMEENM